MSAPDLQAASDALALGISVIDRATATIAALPDADDHQSLLYDLAHAASAVEISRSLIDYGAKGDDEGKVACAFIADALHDLNAKLFGREQAWGVDTGELDPARGFIATYRDPAFVASLARLQAPSHLAEDFEMVADTFRRFGEDKIAPQAEHIHRDDADIPEDIIQGLAELGCFGLSVPEEYGGFASGSESDYLGMVIATEELSRASLGAGDRSSPDRRSSRGRSNAVVPRNRSRSGSPRSPLVKPWSRSPSPSPTTAATWPTSRSRPPRPTAAGSSTA